MFDVHIIGAGPVGSVCGAECARLGAKVLISEEHKIAGIPVQCSGLVSKSGLDALGLGCSGAVLNELKSAVIYSPNLIELHARSKETKAFLLDRAAFDQACLAQAEKEGAKVEFGKKIRPGDYEGRVIIGADGVCSGVARRSGFPEISEYAFCYQATYANLEPIDGRTVLVFLSNEFFPGFFGWIIPITERSARVGVGVYCDLNNGGFRAVKRHFDHFVGRHKIAKGLLGKAKMTDSLAGLIPMRVRERTVSGKIALVGDAAGHAKATTGGGIVLGCAAAKLAARAAWGNISSGAPLERYEKEWRAALGRDFECHRRVRGFLNRQSDASLDRYFTIAKSLGIEMFLQAHGDMDRPTEMLGPLKRSAFAPLLRLSETVFGAQTF